MRRNNINVVNPLAAIFKFMQQKVRVEIWLYDNTETRLQGKILGFDEYMNIVLDDTTEVNIKSKATKQIGKILLKGENVTLVRTMTYNSLACRDITI